MQSGFVPATNSATCVGLSKARWGELSADAGGGQQRPFIGFPVFDADSSVLFGSNQSASLRSPLLLAFIRAMRRIRLVYP